MTSSTVYKLSQLIINWLLKIGVPTDYSVGPTVNEIVQSGCLQFIGFAVHYFLPPVKETPLFNISSKRDQVLQISLDQCFECTWYVTILSLFCSCHHSQASIQIYFSNNVSSAPRHLYLTLGFCLSLMETFLHHSQKIWNPHPFSFWPNSEHMNIWRKEPIMH